jgi:hypothetical protein
MPIHIKYFTDINWVQKVPENHESINSIYDKWCHIKIDTNNFVTNNIDFNFTTEININSFGETDTDFNEKNIDKYNYSTFNNSFNILLI